MSKRMLMVVGALSLLAGVAWSAVAEKEKEAPAAADVAKVKIARDVCAQMMMRVANIEFFDIEDLELWSQHLLTAELDVAATADERRAAYEQRLKRTEELARIAKSYATSGQRPESDALAAEYYRLEAESQLAKLR